MTCPTCGRGKGRRECPALGKTICAVCCGTKRRVEIQCPADCSYLASAREHPAAVVRRQQERDVERLLPSIRHLTERQYQLFFLLNATIARHRPDGLARVLDADIADAAAAFASTLETAAKGVIYEHQAGTFTGQSLVGALKGLLTQVREQGATIYDREAAIALRAIEQGARTIPRTGEGDRAYLELVGRLLQDAAGIETAPAAAAGQAPASSIILP